jgi:hypothetical protein
VPRYKEAPPRTSSSSSVVKLHAKLEPADLKACLHKFPAGAELRAALGPPRGDCHARYGDSTHDGGDLFVSTYGVM